MNDPAIISSAVATLIVVAVALARLVYRLGQLSTQVEHLRHDQTRRHTSTCIGAGSDTKG